MDLLNTDKLKEAGLALEDHAKSDLDAEAKSLLSLVQQYLDTHKLQVTVTIQSVTK